MLSIGSYGHEIGKCRPCNKFNINNPNSCKHGIHCNFCHSPTHDKQKHRGQKGRFALLKRRFIEQYDMYPEWYQDLVKNIYNIPNKIIHDLKVYLYSIEDINIREELVKKISIMITNIGCIAQDKRPDSGRDRNNHYILPNKMVVSDLDGRLKWLQGTIHQTINTMKDIKTDDLNEGEIIFHINKIMKMIENLPNLITNKTDKDDLEWIYKILNELNIIYYIKEDIISIRNIISRIKNISEFNEIQFKNIIINQKITNIYKLIENIEMYYNLVIDNLLKRVENDFEQIDFPISL
jgi:hypothetical protein